MTNRLVKGYFYILIYMIPYQLYSIKIKNCKSFLHIFSI